VSRKKDRRGLVHAGLFAYHLSPKEITTRRQRGRPLEASDLPIACKLTDSDFQQRRAGLLRTVASGVVETKELEDGYAYRFPSSVSWLATLAELITVERECCPFLRFNLRLEPAEGPIWLELTGPPGTKDFLNPILSAPHLTALEQD